MTRHRVSSSRAAKVRAASSDSTPLAAGGRGGPAPSPNAQIMQSGSSAPLVGRDQQARGALDSRKATALLWPVRALVKLEQLLAALSPCPACQAAPATPAGPCRQCTSYLTAAVVRLPCPPGPLYWLAPNAGPWRRLIHALKYGGASRLAPFLGQLLHQHLSRAPWRPTLLTHVPTSASRVEERGFDQADLLAAALAASYGLPHETLLLRRGNGMNLTRLGRAARAAVVAHAFEAAPVIDEAVLLVDDVLTTGATLRAAAAALQAAGAAEVRAAVIARTASREPSPW